MACNWYFARGDKSFGPFSAGQLKELAAGGQILPLDTVWKEGGAKRVLASKVEHLFAAAPPRPPGRGGDAAPAPAPPAGQMMPAVGPAPIPDEMELVPEEGSAPAGTAPAGLSQLAGQPPAREKRVLGVKGGALVSQDGAVVKFRKACLRCGHADTSVTTMPIPNGVAQVNFFCPKCKKNQQTKVHGTG